MLSARAGGGEEAVSSLAHSTVDDTFSPAQIDEEEEEGGEILRKSW